MKSFTPSRSSLACCFLLLSSLCIGCGSDTTPHVVFDADEHAKYTTSPEEEQRRMAEAMANSKQGSKASGESVKSGTEAP